MSAHTDHTATEQPELPAELTEQVHPTDYVRTYAFLMAAFNVPLDLGDIVAEGREPSTADRLVMYAAAQRRIEDAVPYLVRRWRQETGASWQEVGDVLGISRQAAQQRFGRR